MVIGKPHQPFTFDRQQPPYRGVMGYTMNSSAVKRVAEFFLRPDSVAAVMRLPADDVFGNSHCRGNPAPDGRENILPITVLVASCVILDESEKIGRISL